MTAPKDDLNLTLPKDIYIEIIRALHQHMIQICFISPDMLWMDHKSQDVLFSKYYVYFINSAVLDLTTCTNLIIVTYIPIHKTYLSSI